MILRFLSVLALAALIAGGSWYFLRLTPDKEVTALRRKVQTMVGSDHPGDWEAAMDASDREELKAAGKDLKDPRVRLELARKAADRILEIYPTSDKDLRSRALLEERGGNLEGALEFYERFASWKTEPSWAHLERARLYRLRGSFSRAGAELAAAVDQYPFAANLERGKLEMELLQPERALSHFRKALGAAAEPREDPRERIDAQEMVADALNLLLSFHVASRDGREAAGNAAGDAPQSEAAGEKAALEKVERWKRERDAALEEAISLLKQVKPPAGDSSRHHLRLAALHEGYGDPERLREGIHTLERSVALVPERRRAEIHLKLGEMELELAQMRPGERERCLAGAEAHFQKVLSAKAGPGSPEAAGEDEGAKGGADGAPAAGTRDDALVLAVAEKLLHSGESWRLCSGDKEGRKDGLGIAARLEMILLQPGGPAARRAGVLRGTGLLRAGKEKEGEAALARVVESAPPRPRARLEREIPELCFRAAPDSMLFFRFLEAPTASSGSLEPLSLGPAVRLLTSAIAHRQRRLSTGELKAADPLRKTLEEEVKSLDRGREALIENATVKMEDADECLALAGAVAGAGGRDEGIQILKRGRDNLLASGSKNEGKLLALRGQLARWLFEKGIALELEGKRDQELLSEKGPWWAKRNPEAPGPGSWWEAYRESLAEYLPVLSDQPWNGQLRKRVGGLIARFKTEAGATELRLPALLEPLLPSASKEELASFAEVVEKLAVGENAVALSKSRELTGLQGLRPYSTLLQSGLLLWEAERIAPPDRPVEEGDAARSGALRERARAILAAEIERLPGHAALRYEVARVELSSLEPGEDVRDGLLKDLHELAVASGGKPQAYPILMLEEQALRIRFGRVAADSDLQQSARRPGRMMSLLNQRRTALRRAIKANPDRPEPYQALAATYLIGWGGGPLDENLKAFFEPDHVSVVNVLRSAPQTPEILAAIARLYQSELRRPRRALDHYRELLRWEPSETALKAIIGCYLASADPGSNADPKEIDHQAHERARSFLLKFEEEQLPLLEASHPLSGDFSSIKETLLALIAQDEARRATEFDSRRLKDESIERYRKACERYRSAGKPVPVEVLNNLAWLLGEGQATREEGLKLIEEARGRLSSPEAAFMAAAVEDTHAWLLYQAGDFAKAATIYQNLVVRTPAPAYSYRYAKVLFGLADYRGAALQIERALSSRERYDELRDARRLQGEILGRLQKKFEKDA